MTVAATGAVADARNTAGSTDPLVEFAAEGAA